MSDFLEKTNRFNFKRDDDNGMLIGPDGCHYDTEAKAMYYGQICLCGCGRPEEVHRFLLDCLSAVREDSETILSHDKVVNLVKENPDIVAEFVLHFLDDRNLTEHGSSVFGSWLTDRGKQVLEAGPMNDGS